MKKAFIGFAICFIVNSNLFSQSISKTEASEIFQKTLNSLTSNDTASFIDLWYVDNTAPLFNKNKPYGKPAIIEEFKNLQSFLVVPLVKKMPFERIEITETNGPLLSKYKIKAYFKIDDHLQLGYGFLVDYIDNKWFLRWHGETTVSPNN